jgi:Protein of unknown function (DUF3667)
MNQPAIGDAPVQTPLTAAAALPAQGPVPAAVPRCANCDAPVTQAYCGVCGQKADPPVHSLWHFAQHAAEDLTHADSRLWRTLWALLFRPGFLTLEFLHGRRARYLPPLRLYLVVSVAFFLFASMKNDKLEVLQLDMSKPTPSATVTHPGDANSVMRRLPGETPQQTAQRVCAGFDYHGPLRLQVEHAWQHTCPKVVEDNGRELAASYLHNVPRAMFLFLPLIAGIMMLMYWRPRHYYVEHLLLLIHNHAYVFLALLLEWVITAILPATGKLLDPTLFLYVVWYTYRSMRVVYGQGRLLTGAKYAVLGLSYLVLGAFMVGLNMVYSALTL